MKKKILSLALALVMILPICIMSVSAAEEAVWSFNGKSSIFIGDTPTATSKGGTGTLASSWTDSSSGTTFSWIKANATDTGYAKGVAIAATADAPVNMADKDTFTVSATIKAFEEKTDALAGRARIVDIYDCYVNKTNYSGLRYRMGGGSATPTLQYIKSVDNVAVAMYNITGATITAGTDIDIKLAVVEGKTHIYVGGTEVTPVLDTDNAANTVTAGTALKDVVRIDSATHYIGMKTESTSATFKNWTVTTPKAAPVGPKRDVAPAWTFGDYITDLNTSESTATKILTETAGNGVLELKLQNAEFLTDYNKYVALAPTKPADSKNFSVSVNVAALGDGDNWVMNGANGRARLFDLYDNYVNKTNYTVLRYRSAYGAAGTTLQYLKVVDGKTVACYKLDGVITNVEKMDISAGTEHNFTISVVDGKTYIYVDGVEIVGVYENGDGTVPNTTKLCDLERIATAGSCGIKLEHASATLNGWSIASEMLPVITGKIAVGETLTAVASNENGGTYTWLKDGETVLGTGNTYTLKAEDAAHKISVKYTDSAESTFLSHAVYLVGAGGITEGITPPADENPDNGGDNTGDTSTPPANTPADTTPADTTPADTKPTETEAPAATEPAEKKGCGSVIGGGALAVVAVLGCALTFKKKSED